MKISMVMTSKTSAGWSFRRSITLSTTPGGRLRLTQSHTTRICDCNFPSISFVLLRKQGSKPKRQRRWNLTAFCSLCVQNIHFSKSHKWYKHLHTENIIII
uniref:Uncharacterized protein n=1 Tax=Anguilla anguilla TaxID=7936 RepID=A0A0E9XKN6_ANGAN